MSAGWYTMPSEIPEAKQPLQQPTGFKPIELPRRFYSDVAVAAAAGEWRVLLDGKPARTPGKRLLAVAAKRLAQALASEWAAQAERINPISMPLTRLVTTALDGVAGREAAIAADMISYAGSDLLCYRAPSPPGHVALQAERWNPVLDWAQATHDLHFVLAEGIVHVAQPAATLARMAALTTGFDACRLAALHTITTVSGSALLMLAINEQAISPTAAWAAATVDEDWQQSQWGIVEEAAARRTRRASDFHAACTMLQLLGS